MGCARHLARGSLTLQKRTGLFGADLFVLLRRDDLLAAIEACRADVMTAMDFAGRRFDSRRRILQKVMSTTIAATGDRFLILLNSHGILLFRQAGMLERNNAVKDNTQPQDKTT